MEPLTGTSNVDNPSVAPSRGPRPTRGLSAVSAVLRDRSHDWADRRLRLQGWRGAEVRQARAAGLAVRLAPAVCSAAGFAAAWLDSAVIALVVLPTALIGVFADHHPAESLYNTVARRRGLVALPANRAAKRLGCLMGSLLLAGAGASFVADALWIGRFLALSLAFVAAFVASTNVCVPSVLYTAMFGVDRATERDVF